jgi:hypothetical protein
MADIENGESYLTTEVVNKRIAGYTIEEIAAEMDIPTVEVVRAWKDYVDRRNEMSPEEAWVLHLLRLEDLLKKANDRLTHAKDWQDYEVVLKTLDRIEALSALNHARKSEADEALLALTRQQSQLILTAIFSVQNNMRQALEEAFENHKTIKAIKGEVLGSYDNLFTTHATAALAGVSEQ